MLIGGGTGGHDKGWFLEPAVVAEPGEDSRLAARGGVRPGAAGVPLHRLRRRDRAAPTTRRTASAPRSGRTTCARSTAPRGTIDAGHDLGQPDPLRLRRAAVRRHQGLGLRQGARPRGARLLRRAQDRRGRRAARHDAEAPRRSRSTTRRPTPTTSAFMQAFAGDVDEAIASDARVVIVRSASEKFFSAGADVKRFLEGDVDANMEMIRISQAAFRRMAAARAGVHRPHRRPRARRRARDRARLRPARRERGPLQARHAGGHARPAARQRRHAAPDAADRAVAGDGPAAHRPDVRARGGAADGASSTRADATRTELRERAERLAAGPARWRSPRSSAASTRAASCRSTRGSRSRPSWWSGCSAPRTRPRA